MKALICGGRNLKDEATVFAYLDEFQGQRLAIGEPPISCVVTGAASGADYLGEKWAKAREIAYRGHPAPWHRHGPWCKCPRPGGLASQLPATCKAAGMWRNGEMLRRENTPAFPVALVIAFPGGVGTAGMVSLARAARIEVREVAP